MNDDLLLYYYQQELAFMQKMSAAYAAEHPKTAAHLGRFEDKLADPHITRLITAQALSNARMRYRLKSEFSKTSEALLQTLYPASLAPTPSMTMIQFHPSDKEVIKPLFIPANTYLTSPKIQGHCCTFQTRYPVQLLPLTVLEATFREKDNQIIPSSLRADCQSVLKITLSAINHQQDLRKMDFDILRFFIQANPSYAHLLQRFIFKHSIAIGITNSADDKFPVLLENKHIKAVGFEESESMLPLDRRHFSGHTLLQDFFVFPEKFLFFDLVNIGRCLVEKNQQQSDHLVIYLYFNQHNSLLEKSVNKNCFALNCTPVVNLFEQQSEPIILDHTKSEYRVTADARKPAAFSEIYAIKEVFGINKYGSKVDFYPFYGRRECVDQNYYHMRRQPMRRINNNVSGADVFLSFSSLNFCQEKISVDNVIYANVYCSDGNLPSQLPFGGERLILKSEAFKLNDILTASVLTPITPCRYFPLNEAGYWRSVSYLSLNHLSLLGDRSVDVLKSLLKIYYFSNYSTNFLEGILSINIKDLSLKNNHSNDAKNLICHGKDIVITIDESKFSDINIYLFGCILQHFFSLYSQINTFIRLIIKNTQGDVLS